MAWYWDRESCRAYRLKVRPCKITRVKDKDFGLVRLPERRPNLYDIIYKFSPIRNAEAIYSLDNLPRHLHAGFLALEVLILDDRPTNYLNIDRERLKQGAIDEDNLLAVRQKILQKWCAYFLEKDKKKKDLAKKGEEKPGGRFHYTPETLLSLALLFYQNMPREEFLCFIAPYKEFLKAQNLYLENEIPFTSLWEENKLFEIRFSNLFAPIEQTAKNTENVCGEDNKDERTAARLLQETVQCLPHRLIHIRKVFCSPEADLVYLFRLHTQESGVKTVCLSQEGRLYDYAMVFESYNVKPAKTNKKTNINYLSLQKKLFKPDSRYEELLLPCYPKNFTKGRNFNTSMDHCFTWYLLSPFDSEMCLCLKRSMDDENCSREALVEALASAMKESRQLGKCIDYILRKRYVGANDEQQKMEFLRQKYIHFAENFCTLLFDNRRWLEQQFSQDFE